MSFNEATAFAADDAQPIAVPSATQLSFRQPTVNRQLIVALDFSDVNQARQLVQRLGSEVEYYKIGLELLFQGGLSLASELEAAGKWVFLDMKLLDIENTVEKAVRNVARLGFQFLTIHGLDSKTIEAAKRGRGDSSLQLLSVTVLTNLTAVDLHEQGILETPSALAVRRAIKAFELGFDGVIASGQEAAAIRRATSKDFIIKTPGIRLPSDSVDDQSRATTPSQAIEAGASYLVVGRPITKATDPVDAARRFKKEIERARHNLYH